MRSVLPLPTPSSPAANLAVPAANLAALRARIKVVEQPVCCNYRVLPFGVPAIDARLPRRGLVQGALHEVSGNRIGRRGDHLGTAALMFAASIAARLPGRILWCSRSAQDVFLPGLLAAGMDPDRVLCAEAPDEAGVLQVMEEALRHPGLACVVGELARLPITASRRLNLAAESSGVMAIALRRNAAAHLDPPTAAVTRWRVGPSPSPAPLRRPEGQGRPLALPGRGYWHLELTRCRGGEAGSWIVEACDAQGRLALPAVLGDRPAAPSGASGDWPHHWRKTG